MDKLEKDLLNMVQNDFPLSTHPFQVISEKLGISEEHCIDILKKFSDSGVLRSIRAVINWNRIGYFTILIGIKVDPTHISEIAEELQHIDEITHNYSRAGQFNLWFTLIYKSTKEKDALIEHLLNKQGVIDIKEFPTEKTYKIGLKLDV
ncbi:MAG TPA: Lrp/AsnC family transcriptional regulator [Chitinispirillaceae bacterium]|nr:Lrp/AsnC family transcriptional regulator [Chitinispirillaceae bacterium]